VVNYNQQQSDVLFDLTSKAHAARRLPPRVGRRHVLAGQLSQSGPLASGQLSRNVGLAGLTFRPAQKLSVNLDYEGRFERQHLFPYQLERLPQDARAGRVTRPPRRSCSRPNFQVLNKPEPGRGPIQLRF